MNIKMKTLVICCLGLVVFASACTTPSIAAKPQTISLSGAWAIYPLAVKWAEAFKRTHPNVRIDISAGGAGKGMADALSGAVDIGMVSREIDRAEKRHGAYPIFIAKDGVFVTVNGRCPAAASILSHGVTRQALVAAFVTGKVTTWKQLAGGPSAPVHIYTRSDACGAAGALASFLGAYRQDNLKGIGVYGDPGVLEAVRRDRLGLGYNNLGFVFTGNKPTAGVIIVPIDANRNGKADPNELITSRAKAAQAIASGVYPASRREFFVTKGKPKGIEKDFIAFALSDAGVRILNEVGGYVPLSKPERQKQLAALR
jgi:phosphate transport system substrate-binding protein